MVQILPAVQKAPKKRSTAERFVDAFSSSADYLSEAIPKYYEAKSKQQEKIAARQDKIPGDIAKGTSSFLKRRGTYDVIQQSGKMRDFEALSRKYAEEGYGIEDALELAHDELLQRKLPKEDYSQLSGKKEEKESSWADKLLGIPSKLKSELLEYPEKAKRQVSMMGRKLAGTLEPAIPQLEAYKSSPLMGLVPHGKEIPSYESRPQLTEAYDKFFGETGIPRTPLEEVAASAVFGVPGMIGEAGAQAIKAAGLPDWAAELGNVGLMILTQGRLNKFSSSRTAEKALKKAADASKRTGKPVDAILEETGVNLSKVAAGDEEATNLLAKRISEIPEVASKVSETPKEVYNRQAASREREVFGERLPESPLEEYYGIREREALKESRKRPETRLREEAIREELAPVERQLFRDLREAKDELTSIKRERLRAPESERFRFDEIETIQFQRLKEINDNLKDVQYQMKYGRARPTEAQINAQVEKHIGDVTESFKNPTPESIAKAEKVVEDDRRILESAKKILDRGELPGEINPDTFIKMQQKYLKGYQEAIAQQQRIIDGLTSTSKKTNIQKAQLKEAQDLMKLYKDRASVLEAKIINQTDNIKAMRALEKPSGAFYKNQLKNTRKDLEIFNHDFFKRKRVVSPGEEFKTKSLGKKVFSEKKAQELGQKIVNEDPKLTAKELAKQVGIPEKQAEKLVSEIKSTTSDVSKKVKDGTLNPADEKKFIDILKKISKTKTGKTAIAAASGYAYGVAHALIEHISGEKPDSGLMSLLKSFLRIPGKITGGYSAGRNFFDSLQARELKEKLKDPSEAQKYIENMKKKYGSAKVKRVMKILKEEKEKD